ncbi:MAG: glycyl-radical enzyme activating protein [Desulfobacterales bacterium]
MRAPSDSPPKGLVLSIDRFVGEDGPGIRTTVFMKGCPLRCVWCHSPESISPKPQLLFQANRCIGCGACTGACPRDAHIVSPSDRRVLWERCDDCEDCVPVCPSASLDMAGKWMTVQQVLEVVKKDRVYYRNSGGGVSFCGGEATMQHEFLLACLKACRDAGIDTALDTCGQVKWSVLSEMLPYIDLFLYDIKHMDSSRHKELTGVGNELILENLEKICQRGKPVWVRIPLIPGFNDSEENLKKTAAFVAPLDTVEKISLLPYNVVSGAKYPSIGETYPLEQVVAHTKDEEKALAKMLSGFGKKTEVGG